MKPAPGTAVASNKPLSRSLAILMGLGLFLVALASMTRASWNALMGARPSFDFLWDKAKLLLEGQNPYALDLLAAQQSADPSAALAHLTTAVPSSLVTLWPYALLPFSTATVAWLATNFLATIVIVVLSFRLFLPQASWHVRLLVGLCLIASGPWRFAVSKGQHGLFCLAFFLVALFLAEKRRHWLAGVALALSFFKYSLIFPLLPFFLRRNYFSPLVIGFGIHGALTLFVALWLGQMPHTIVFQSLEVARLLEAEGFIDIFALSQSLGAASDSSYLLIVSLVAMAVLTILVVRSEADDLFVMSVLALFSMIVLYHRPHDFFVLIFPALLVIREVWVDEAKWTAWSALGKWPAGFCVSMSLLSVITIWFGMGLLLPLKSQLARFEMNWVYDSALMIVMFAFYAALLAGLHVLATTGVPARNPARVGDRELDDA